MNQKNKPPSDFPMTEAILKKELATQKFEDFKANEINWIDGDFWDSWEKIKGHFRNIIRPNSQKKYQTDTTPRVDKWFFLSHANDEIIGKPQLIENVMKRIPLIRLTTKIKTQKKTKEEKKLRTEDTNYKVPRYIFFDERYDKRYDGAMLDAFAMDFWFYRIVTVEGKEYYILTQEKLPNCTCTFKGMKIELDDVAEISRSMKLKSLSRFFFVKEFIPNIRILSPEDLIDYTKKKKISSEDWLEFLSYHPLGTQNKFPKDVEMLKSAWLLSGEIDNYPLHLGILGRQGTRKSKGYIEVIAHKFEENFKIVEGANSRLKGLTPSFRERPANLGYLAKQERIGFIDELGKLVEQQMDKDNQSAQNVLGEANFLLDHSHRLVGSGNDNDVEVQATAKFMFVLNPVRNCSDINAHVGVLDSTFMSRVLWWVQDESEEKFVLSAGGIVKSSANTNTSLIRKEKSSANTNTSLIRKEKEKENTLLKMCWRKITSRDEFITLFDSCQDFTVYVPQDELIRLANMTTQLAKYPMKEVWKPRAEHHINLLIDGIVKHRCLFTDYDSTFTAKEEDYSVAERILFRMIKAWGRDLSLKKEYFGGGFL